MKIKTIYKTLLSDLTTPVSLFLKLRETFAEVMLLESSDYSSKENSLSFICFDSLATLEVKQHVIVKNDFASVGAEQTELKDVVQEVSQFVESFSIDAPAEIQPFLGLFGYTSFDAIKYFETIQLDDQKEGYSTPDIRYDLFRNIIVFDHFYGKMMVIENIPEAHESRMEKVLTLINKQDHQAFTFSTEGEEHKNMTDQNFMDNVTQSKSFCQRGDVFQIVPSRRFAQEFKGDEFNVYRSLRSINPSPYLFYFDYGSYKIFGSSPEAQMVIKKNIAEIHPIAGTFRRTGNVEKDIESAKALSEDPKENAEHTMLVDLARNDLSKNTTNVHVEKYKEVQYFSHVIHLTSVVKGTLKEGVKPYQIFADTFPAGTLSGAPKYRAMELIDDLEPTSRGFYGGGIGMLGFNGDINHAIMIRSFLSYEGKLHYQAGAGIVIDSQEEKELQEVNNKLAALKKALQMAENISL
ncbi:MAG: anthranilate synthase component I family protein [Saprospiraceae bacterium]|nr:anthranilate synthase component I family protein [Saprospiraceae bacterium]